MTFHKCSIPNAGFGVRLLPTSLKVGERAERGLELR